MTALFAMGRSHNECWFETIVDELSSKEPKLRIEAINAAAEARVELATPKLRSLTSDQNKEVRLAAIWALAHTRGPGAVETLEMCAESNDEDVARLARDAVEEYYAGLTDDRPPEEGDGDGF
jgi:HEAT repeat protein